MRRWVSEDTTNTTTRRGQDFRSTTTGTPYTTDDTPSTSFARAPAPSAPAQDVSLGQLTYSINSSLPSSARCKAPTCERHEQLRAVRHRACQSEGQLRPILLPPPPRQPVNVTSPLPPLADGHQLGTTQTTPHQAPGVLYQGQGGQGLRVGCSGRRPTHAVLGSSQGAVAAKSPGVSAECTRRDVATATDTVPSEHNSRWGDWMGGEKLLIVGAALLSILLVASAAATTASIVDRRSTAASVAGVAPTEPLLPGMVPFTEPPRRDVEANEASAGASWKTPSTTSEPAEEDLTTEQPGVGYGNASGDSVTAEDLLALPFRRPAKPECGAVFYTHCRKPRREFLYRASLNACLATADDRPAQLCNRGTNRFTSWRECESSCVLTEPPLEACLDKTLLLGCRRQDVRTSWWWFDGRVCLAWNFPAGGCPANGSAVFATADQCTARCTNPRYPPCTAPRTQPCSSEQLKFPFFAAEAPSSAVQGRRHCFRLTRRVLESHRCLTGANRFLTKAACESACKKKAPSTRP
ncbi:hypothetical protein HPB49_019283 [Dermacentor silvarum]|uniref:Uncharacterized protein n=1 Tax=Dermacentor silvarum TaxID=543639 RepID=A0ACB8CAY6_DERSI|nr:hypothetical protein HPB49_019283 [Dermacentor silvarum]